MAKKEFKVGEVFQCGLIKLRVVKEDENSCLKCFFNKTFLCGNMDQLIGSCSDVEREDETDVIFVKVEDIEN